MAKRLASHGQEARLSWVREAVGGEGASSAAAYPCFPDALGAGATGCDEWAGRGGPGFGSGNAWVV